MTSFSEGLQSLTPDQVEEMWGVYNDKATTPDGAFTDGFADKYTGLIILGGLIEDQLAGRRSPMERRAVGGAISSLVFALIELAEADEMRQMFPDFPDTDVSKAE